MGFFSSLFGGGDAPQDFKRVSLPLSSGEGLTAF